MESDQLAMTTATPEEAYAGLLDFGTSALITMLITNLYNANKDTIGEVADRLLTLPEARVRQLCHALHIENEDGVQAVLAAFRSFGDAGGNILRAIAHAKVGV